MTVKCGLTLAGELAVIFYRNPDAWIVPADCPFPDEDAGGFVEYVNTHPEFDWNEIIERDRMMCSDQSYED